MHQKHLKNLSFKSNICNLFLMSLLLQWRRKYVLSFTSKSSNTKSLFPEIGRTSFKLNNHFKPLFTNNISKRKISTSELLYANNKITEGINDIKSKKNQNIFKITAPYEASGDQPEAIEQICRNLNDGNKFTVLQGQTGTGKTFVMSHIIARNGKPTLVLCHNKTLAAQLARELRSCLRNNSVELFISYYNYYLPENFNEATQKYTMKKSSINSDIDALRHRATRALVTRKDVVIVSSVSCIYGLGLPREYLESSYKINVGDQVHFEGLLSCLGNMLYSLNDNDDEFERGNYQLPKSFVDVNGIERKFITIWEPHDSYPLSIGLFKAENDEKYFIDFINQAGSNVESCRIFPAKHHVTPQHSIDSAVDSIEEELKYQMMKLNRNGKFEESARLHKRVTNDVERIKENGTCEGVENYSRHFSGREEGEPPDTLVDFLELHEDWLLIVDESHVTLPQLKAMYNADRARKLKLIKHGYRLPSALDNRPLKETEFWKKINQTLFVSATPAERERNMAERSPVPMIIRPTYVADPVIEIRPPNDQLDDILTEVRERVKRDEKSLVICLTKRDAEDLASFLSENEICSTFIHSGLSTTERSDALRALQSGEIDCLVGVNILREGLDLPQVSLVAILNADADGFLRSSTALTQIVGRCARNIKGKAIFYANRVTDNMRDCIDETANRRRIQLEYNKKNGCKMRTTSGSSIMSIFDLLQDQIAAEQSLEIDSHSNENEQHISRKRQNITEKPTIESSPKKNEINTESIPARAGVYLFKDAQGKILYIGKAKKLRSRVRSYFSSKTKHSSYVKFMVKKAHQISFILTPSERDALILESKLIKFHQPDYNILLKDDSSYPYIEASIGDKFPSFKIVSAKQQRSLKNRNYRYFGPYTSSKEIHEILNGIEEKYKLRHESFVSRFSDGSNASYLKLFHAALEDVFGKRDNNNDKSSLAKLRSEYEEASHLFESEFFTKTDVVAVAYKNSTALVHLVQLRQGRVQNQFSYECKIPTEDEVMSDEDKSATIITVLEKNHYPSGEESAYDPLSFFPDELLVPVNIDKKLLRNVILNARNNVQLTADDDEISKNKRVNIRSKAISGERRASDERALDLAHENAYFILGEKLDNAFSKVPRDESALIDISSMLSLTDLPRKIECYDVSHTQGDYPVASRVVFVDGEPVKSLYRKFNIRNVEGIDDYKSIEEVMERRFKRSWVNGKGGLVDESDPWCLPDLILIDGGKGQLSAALSGMSKAQIYHSEDSSYQIEEEERKAFVPVCSIAKQEEQVFIPERKDHINKSPDSPGLLLLRRLRDESHRFALNSHRKRRNPTNST